MSASWRMEASNSTELGASKSREPESPGEIMKNKLQFLVCSYAPSSLLPALRRCRSRRKSRGSGIHQGSIQAATPPVRRQFGWL